MTPHLGHRQRCRHQHPPGGVTRHQQRRQAHERRHGCAVDCRWRRQLRQQAGGECLAPPRCPPWRGAARGLGRHLPQESPGCWDPHPRRRLRCEPCGRGRAAREWRLALRGRPAQHGAHRRERQQGRPHRRLCLRPRRRQTPRHRPQKRLPHRSSTPRHQHPPLHHTARLQGHCCPGRVHRGGGERVGERGCLREKRRRSPLTCPDPPQWRR